MSFMGGAGMSALSSNCTWDPLNKSTGITLSNGNLTATQTSGSSQYLQVFATDTRTAGFYYCEFIFSGIVTNNNAFGIVDPSGSLVAGNLLGGDAHSLGNYLEFSGGHSDVFTKTNAITGSQSFPGYGGISNFVISYCVSPDQFGNIFNVNNQSSFYQGNNFLLNLAGRPNFRIAATLFDPGASVTVNFGQTPYIYPILPNVDEPANW